MVVKNPWLFQIPCLLQIKNPNCGPNFSRFNLNLWRFFLVKFPRIPGLRHLDHHCSSFGAEPHALPSLLRWLGEKKKTTRNGAVRQKMGILDILDDKKSFVGWSMKHVVLDLQPPKNGGSYPSSMGWCPIKKSWLNQKQDPDTRMVASCGFN